MGDLTCLKQGSGVMSYVVWQMEGGTWWQSSLALTAAKETINKTNKPTYWEKICANDQKEKNIILFICGI